MRQNVFLKGLLNGDSKEILKIYEKCFPQVKAFVIRNKGKKEDAEDIFQKALLQIAVRYKKEMFTITSSFEGYLYTVCKNLWRRELKKYANRVTNKEVEEQLYKDDDQFRALIEQKREELFIEKLNDLSDNCKSILRLFFAKTSYSEMLSITDYSSETVIRQRVFKCKRKLTELVKQDPRFNELKEL
ncbi:sigma-70 family RNA polymerase sigma factor [Tenacibaculum sp. 190524A02b]|uniref:RNA polymerase sigma factor n=1 Tax=Tenacibaculum vairaonense TaxID=3137860 RepID=UPI0031FA5DD8